MPNVNNDVKVKMPLQPQVSAKKAEEQTKAETKDLSNEVMDKLSAAANINKAVVTKPIKNKNPTITNAKISSTNTTSFL